MTFSDGNRIIRPETSHVYRLDAHQSTYNPGLEGLRYDPALAKQLLQESPYADPGTRPTIILSVPGTGGTIGLDREVIIEMWQQTLGVEVEVQQVEWATYLEDLDRRRFQMFAVGWEAEYVDPQDFIDVLFNSQSDINHGGYSNPLVDALLGEARVEQDEATRFAIYQAVEAIVADDAAWVPLWHLTEQHVLIKPHIKGYVVTPIIVPKLRHVYVE